jgi:hypothetical protein
MEEKRSGRSAQQVDAEIKEKSDWQIKYLAEKDPDRKITHLAWSELTDGEQDSQRARNEIARREYQRKRAAAKADAEKQERQQREKLFNEALAAFRAERRVIFGGTDEQFSRIWPQLEAEFLLDAAKAQSSLDSNKSFLKASGKYGSY